MKIMTTTRHLFVSVVVVRFRSRCAGLPKYSALFLNSLPFFWGTQSQVKLYLDVSTKTTNCTFTLFVLHSKSLHSTSVVSLFH
jgi:hypothetical protein